MDPEKPVNFDIHSLSVYHEVVDDFFQPFRHFVAFRLYMI